MLRSLLNGPFESVNWYYSGVNRYQTFKSGSFHTQLWALIKDKTIGYLEPVLTTFPTL